MPDHALELSFDPHSESAVLAQWQALRDAGLPSQADHRSMTNAPHLTVAAASPIGPRAVTVARRELLPLLPTRLLVRGLVLLGQGPRATVAHLVEPDARVAAAAAAVRASVCGLRHPVWTPHITLARRVPRRRLPEVLDVLAELPLSEVAADRLRWWDPDLAQVLTVTPDRAAPCST